MKTQAFIKIAIATTATLTGYAALAQSPAGVTTAIGRSASNVANPERIDGMLDKTVAPMGEASPAGDLSIKGDKPLFEFKPTGKAEGEWKKLTDEQKAHVNRLGCEIVGFYEPEVRRDRIDSSVKGKDEGLRKVREPEAAEAREKYNKARDERIKAGQELVAVKNRRPAAERALADAQKNLAEVQRTFDEIEARIEHADDNIRDVKRDIDAQKEKLEVASRDLGRAEKARDDAQKKEAEAREARKLAAENLKKAGADRVAAAEALEKAAAAVKSAGEAVKAKEDAERDAEKSLSDATGAKKEAAKAVASAGKDVGRAERALEKAGDAQMKADAEAAKARGDVAKAQDTKKAADEAVKAARPTNPDEKQGFWARWALRKAEKRARRAQDALDAAEGNVPRAEAALKGAVKAKKDAAHDVDGKKGVLKEKERILGEKTAALEKAKDALGAAKIAMQKADDGLRTAKTAEEGARKAEREAVRAEKRAEQEDENAQAKLDDAGKDVEKAKVDVEDATAKRDVEDVKSKELEAAKNPAEQAAIIWKPDREKAKKDLEAAQVEVGRRQEELDRLAEDSAQINRLTEQFENAKKSEEQLRPYWEEKQRLLDNSHSDAIKQVTEEERGMGNALDGRKDDLFGSIEGDLAKAGMVEAGHGVEATADDLRKSEDAWTAATNNVAIADAQLAGLVAEAKAARAAFNAAAEGDKDGLAAAMEDADRKVAEKKSELQKLKGDAKDAAAALRAARRSHDANRKFADGVAGRAADSVAILRREFDRQVENTIKHLEDEPGIVEPEGAAAVRTAFRKKKAQRDRALAAYLAARKALDDAIAASNRNIPWDREPNIARLFAQYNLARENYARQRDGEMRGETKIIGFDELEDKYNTFFSDAIYRTDMSLSDEAADARYDTDTMRRDLYGYRVKGDRRWLARTSVDGENLLDVLANELAWQAEKLVEANEAKRDEYDPLRIVLADEQKQKCAAAAADYLKRRAVYGGFYFCGADAGSDDSEKFVWVDKGRFGPATVNFGKFGDGGFVNSEDGGLSGRIYGQNDILDRFAPHNASTNTLEGEAFNFIDFRKKFNALNANPDIKRADVQFEPVSSGFDYGYDDEDFKMGGYRQKNRAVKAVVNVEEERRPAPIHGMLSIDNFNSMGKPDQIAGEIDKTWMARLLLQRRLGLFADEDALSLQGSTTFGSALQGGALGYYVPRDDEARFWRSGELADALSWTVHGGYTRVNEEDVIDGLNVLGTGWYAGLQVSTRVAETVGGTWDVSVGLTYRSVENSVEIGDDRFDLGPNGDPYEIAPLSLALIYSDKDIDGLRGRNFATLEGVYNLGGMLGGSDADELKSFRPAIDSEGYFLARLQLARLQLMNESSESLWLPRMVFLRLDGQYASTPLIGAEQYGLGGHGTVRGYVEREFMGDHGASASVEFRTPIILNPAWLEKKRNNPYKSGEQLQFVYFVDAGWYQLDKAAGNDVDDNILIGLGFGLRYSLDDMRVFGRGISPTLRLDWAYPVWQQNDVADDATSSAGVIHASLQFPF